MLWKLRHSGLGWWTAAFVLAALSALAVDTAIRAADEQRSRFGVLRTVAVVVEPVAPGEVLAPGDFEFRDVPAALLPEGAASRAPAGRVALVELIPGEIVLDVRLAPTGLRGAAALLPPGSVALAVPAGPAGRPPLSLGDRVDLLASFEGEPTFAVAAGATVIAVDEDTDIVTVAVTRDEAPRVAYALAHAPVTIALSRV